jgi:type I restriction enzyme S subunit
MGEWKEYKLGEISNYLNRGVSPSYVESDGYTILNQKCIRNGKIDFLLSKRTSAQKKYSKEKLLQEGDILINSTGVGTAGRVAIFMKDVTCYADTHISIVRIDKDFVHSKFIFYNLFRREDEIENYAEGSTGQIELGRDKIKDIDILLPTLPEQTAIASILSSLDDKIDLLHRQNATLEKMAETLFRQWFVEEAKEEWKNGKVSDLIKILSGYAFKSSSFVESGKYRLITIKGVQDGYLELNNADKIEEVPDRMPDFCKLEIGDIILSLTGNVGRCCLVDTTDLLLNQRVAKLHPIYERDRAYTYFLFRQPQIKQLLEEMGKGTAQPNLSPIETSNMELIIPDEEKLIEFSVMATPLLNKMLFNKKSIQTLTALRDTLLPKLMSGEVRVVQD